MKNIQGAWLILSASLAVTACASGGMPDGARNLSATQCRDIAELRNNAPLTRERNQSELAALRKAGYDPSRWFDPYYPGDLEAAQRQVDRWFQAECR